MSRTAMNTAAGVRGIAWDPDGAATAVRTEAATTVRIEAATAIRTEAATSIGTEAATSIGTEAATAAVRTLLVRRILIGPRQRLGRLRRFRIAHEATEGGHFRSLV
jgi:hypothetical protein